MRKTRFLSALLLAIGLGWTGLASAQNAPAAAPATAPAPATAAVPGSAHPIEQRIERIHIEDAGSRIDELRVGGETQSITVSPKDGMPPYEVIPNTANRSPAAAERSNRGATGGTRVWNVLKF